MSKVLGMLVGVAPLLGAPNTGIAQCQPASDDIDADCIPDTFEYDLLDRFRPIIVTDQVQGGPGEFRAIPANAHDILQHSELKLQGIVPAARPTAAQVLAIDAALDPQTAEQRPPDVIEENAKWGGVPRGHPSRSSWADAIASGHAVYGRLSKPSSSS